MMTMILMIMMPAALRAVIPRSFWPPSGLHPVNPRASWWCSGIPVWPLACGGGDAAGGRRGMLFFLSFRGGIARQWWCSGIRVWPLACTFFAALCARVFARKRSSRMAQVRVRPHLGGLVRCWLCQRLAYDLSKDR